jgi:hypothetical protein
MIYRLVWPIPMLKRLEEQYLRARAAGLSGPFTAAVHRIEQTLVADPFACGESRDGTIRIHIDLPVAVMYEADASLAAVTIHNVLYYRPRRL